MNPFEAAVADYVQRWQAGDRANARDRAQTIVERHPTRFEAFAGLGLDACVAMVSGYRAAGETLRAQAADIWCQATFGPQRIVGKMG